MNDREDRVARGHDERADLPVARGGDLVGEDAARQLAEDARVVADRAPVTAVAVEPELGGETREVDEVVGEDGAGGGVEVGGRDVDGVEGPRRDRREVPADVAD